MADDGIEANQARMPKRGFESFPEEVMEEILLKLDLESLCCAATTCKLLHLSVSTVLPKLQTINFSEISMDKKALCHLLCTNKSVQNLTLNCSRLNDSSIDIFNSSLSSLQELVLQKCSNFSPKIFVALGQHFSNLRVLSLELLYYREFETCEGYIFSLKKLFEGCPFLESLSIKFEGPEYDPYIFEATAAFIPTTVKILHLQHVTEKCAKLWADNWGVQRIAETSAESDIHSSLGVSFQSIQSLSLVIDQITDDLLTSITQNLLLLVKLDLRDEPLEEQLLRHDLTNRGLQSLGSCNYLSHLSLVRSRANSTFFRRVNDMGMFLMAEACKNMESFKLGGFQRVTDAGFSALIHTCKNLRTFELYDTFHLSDLAFLGLLDTSLSLVSVRLILCKLITSESVKHLSLCENLELLDLNGCKSVADYGMRDISRLKKLSTLYLSGADITDTGLKYLGDGKAPLVSLSLRGCKRVTDHGIVVLLGGSIKKTLKALDLGYIPGISDKAIKTLTELGLEIVDLCIRNCYSVTDISIAALASKAHCGVAGRALRRLDLYNCIGLSAASVQWLNKPYFPQLRWLGLGPPSLFTVHSWRKLVEIIEGRSCLSVCQEGCEIGCRDRWKFHENL